MSIVCRKVVRCFGSGLVSVGIVLTSFDGSAALAAKPAKEAKSNTADSPDLRPQFEKFGLTARAQGKRPTCSVFTMTGAIEFALAKQGRKDPRLSIDYLNWASNQAKGEDEDGSMFSDLWDGFVKCGQCSEEEMPYRSEFDPKREPSEELQAKAKLLGEAGLHMRWIKYWNPHYGVNDRQLQRIKRVIRTGYPVCGGFLWPKEGLETWNKGGLLTMYPRKKMRDGHSILLIGYRDDPNQPGGGVFMIRNSGSGLRHGTITYEYAKAYMNDAVWIGPEKKSKKSRESKKSTSTAQKASKGN